MKIKLFLVSYLIFISFKAISQFNINQYSDIILNWPASIDTQYQFFDEIKSTQGESTLLSKLFPYQTTQFINSYNNINTLDSIIPIEDMSYKGYISWENDSNYYTANKLNFKIEDDTSTVFFLKNKAIQDSSTAFIVIPGSGINQATYVGIYNPYNYHNSTCAIANFRSILRQLFLT